MHFYLLKSHETDPGLCLDTQGDGLTFRKELIYEGDFSKKHKNGEVQQFSIDDQLMNHWCNTGNTMIQNSIKVPAPVKHTDDPEAQRAEIIRYERDRDSRGKSALYGVFKFNDHKAAKLAASTDVSIFVPAETFMDCAGNEYPYVIRHVALTDYPVINKLEGFQPIAASNDELVLDAFEPVTKKEHATHAALHGGLGYLEYRHAKHVGSTIGRFAKSQYAKGGIKQVAKAALSKGAFRAKLPGRIGLGVAMGALAVHGVVGGAHAVSHHLAAIPKAPQPKKLKMSLSLAQEERRDKIGRWVRGIAGASVAALGATHIAKAVAKPIALGIVRHAIKAPALSKGHKAAIAAETLHDIAVGAAITHLGYRISKEPSKEVKQESPGKHRLNRLGHNIVGVSIAGGALDQAGKAGLAGHKAATAGKIVHEIAREGLSPKRKLQMKIIGHAVATRPAAAMAVGHALAAGALGYGAHRAFRKAAMHREATHKKRTLIEASLELAYIPENKHHNIIARNELGRFASKGAGHSSNREIKRLRKIEGDKYYIRDHSNEDVHSSDRLTHGLHALKHAALGAIEGGGAAAAVLAVTHKTGIHLRDILKTPLKGAAGKAMRTRKFKAIAAGAAAAAGATAIAHDRGQAALTHLRKAFGR